MSNKLWANEISRDLSFNEFPLNITYNIVSATCAHVNVAKDSWRTIPIIGWLTKAIILSNEFPTFINFSHNHTLCRLLCCHLVPLLTWRRHQMETFSALLAICAWNSPIPGEFHAQRPVTRSFDVFFYLRLNKRSSKQSRCWWFETLSHPLRRHCNDRIENGKKTRVTIIITVPADGLALGHLQAQGWHIWGPALELDAYFSDTILPPFVWHRISGSFMKSF